MKRIAALCIAMLLLLTGCAGRHEIVLPDRTPRPEGEGLSEQGAPRYLLAEGAYLGRLDADGSYHSAAALPGQPAPEPELLARILGAEGWMAGSAPLPSLSLETAQIPGGFDRPGVGELLAPYAGFKEGSRMTFSLPTLLEGEAGRLTLPQDGGLSFGIPAGQLVISGGEGVPPVTLNESGWEPAADLLYALVREKTGAEPLTHPPVVEVLGAGDLLGDGGSQRLISVSTPRTSEGLPQWREGEQITYHLLVMERSGSFETVLETVCAEPRSESALHSRTLEFLGAWNPDGGAPELLCRLREQKGDTLLLLGWNGESWQPLLAGR